MTKYAVLIMICSSMFFSCSQHETISVADAKPVLPDVAYAYDQLKLPKGTSPAVFNTITAVKFVNGQPVFVNGQTVFDPNHKININSNIATLGRVLFYDKKLSLNNTVSCGSCHHQDKAFADGQQFSKGFEGKITSRNSMGITNAILQNNLFWDSRAKSIHDLSLQPVKNHIEMGMENMDRLVAKIQETDYYKPLFQKAYSNQQITPEKISMALSEFVGSITSNRSRFDQGLETNFAQFTELEKLGKEIFHSDRAKCSSCHAGNNFSAEDGPSGTYGSSFSGTDLRGATNIGLDLDYKDNGFGDGKFKIPGLRNVSLTAPYMHDGRFKSLEDVVDHYSSGVKPHRALDTKFTDGKGNVKQLNLNSLEKKALVAFLHTLTDQEMISDPKWSDPFQR